MKYGKSYNTRVKKAFAVFVVFIIFSLTMLAAGWRAMQFIAAPLQAATLTSDYVEVVVQSGDTLWSLASVHGPVGFDRRQVVWAIKTVNKLESPQLKPGDIIRIPICIPDNILAWQR